MASLKLDRKVDMQSAVAILSRRLLPTLLAGLACAALLPAGMVSAQTTNLKPVGLSVPGPGSGVSLPLELAVKLGLDRAEGIELRLKFVGGGGIAFQDIVSGNSEYGVYGLPAAMSQRLKDPRIVALAALDDLPLYTLMVRNDLRSKVRRVADLKGRSIGVHSTSLTSRTTSDQVLELVLSSHGVSRDDIRSTSVGQNWETESAAFLSGNVDAMMNDEPFATRMASEKIAFQLYSTGNPADAKQTPGAGFLRAALIGRRDRIDADAQTAERMVNLVKRVLRWMASHSAQQMADALEFKPGTERTAFLAVAGKFPRQYSRDGKFSTAQLKETETFFRSGAPGDAQAQSFRVNAMVIDRWAGTKP
jgi:NitT/TauT family transport system substrate-binding protein